MSQLISWSVRSGAARALRPSLAAVALVVLTCRTASAQLAITAPSASVSIAHDATNNDQVFAAQNWQVQCNDNQGGTVMFSTNQAFRNTADGTYQRDARLDLSIASAAAFAQWAVTVASDQTNYAAADGVATVQARSNRRGDATFDLTVTFLTVQYDTLAEGAYQLTVTGTLTGN